MFNFVLELVFGSGPSSPADIPGLQLAKHLKWMSCLAYSLSLSSLMCLLTGISAEVSTYLRRINYSSSMKTTACLLFVAITRFVFDLSFDLGFDGRALSLVDKPVSD